jgi:hypothetical protein
MLASSPLTSSAALIAEAGRFKEAAGFFNLGTAGDLDFEAALGLLMPPEVGFFGVAGDDLAFAFALAFDFGVAGAGGASSALSLKSATRPWSTATMINDDGL